MPSYQAGVLECLAVWHIPQRHMLKPDGAETNILKTLIMYIVVGWTTVGPYIALFAPPA